MQTNKPTHIQYAQLRVTWRISVRSTAQYGSSRLKRTVGTAAVASIGSPSNSVFVGWAPSLRCLPHRLLKVPTVFIEFRWASAKPPAHPTKSRRFRRGVQPREAALFFLLDEVEIRLLGLHADAADADERN